MTARRISRLAKARQAVGFSQEEFASRLNVHPSTIGRWETTPTQPLPYLRPKIAKILGVTQRQLEELLDDKADSSALERASISLQSDIAGEAADTASHSTRTWEQLAKVSDSAIETNLRIVIDIAQNGDADVAYYHEILNLGALPLTRLRRDLWFESTAGKLRVTSISSGMRRVIVQPIHDTDSLAKFACQITPPIEPGESATFAYQCSGGRFVESQYWRETITRYTRQFSIQVVQRGGRKLVAYKAVEEHPDGRENSTGEGLIWSESDGDITVVLRRELLLPNHAVLLRWDIERRESAQRG